MSGETRQYRQCTCSASFETEHNLSEHIEGIRSLERRLEAEIERCRSHVKVDDKNGPDNHDGSDDHEDNCYGECKTIQHADRGFGGTFGSMSVERPLSSEDAMLPQWV
ncbi:hypothetical protein VDGE_30790 [Verticillium dahliae]|uniref:C2H2-type domain-containing protein n=1 Tax=Verticillium dahliae TaxID=27337 RepID=A0A444RIX4_VERDA|nr:hypothetical protein VDGE_30790 [Verticillium dahliae]